MAYIAKSDHFKNWKLREDAVEFEYYGHGANGMLFLSRQNSRIRKVPFGGGYRPTEQLVQIAKDELQAVKLAANSCWTRKYIPLPVKETPNGRVYNEANTDISDELFLTSLSFEMSFIQISGATEMKFGSANSHSCKLIVKKFGRIGITYLVDATVWEEPDGKIQKIVDFGIDPKVHDPK
ncbi:hypothetical protein [Sagittula salina]|uniref:Uncharacterized protein n=1 Tax=Sagittula salina TaxID=2820268 RepID=A0A940S3L1_9RHOB|nr:hypothetical protein [Sagittula salina]MBP0485207.1 hypothetical protein [Sagittula salina]